MKTLMQMDNGVVFFETIISLKHQKHTCIEAVPVPFDVFDQLPAYFQVCCFVSPSIRGFSTTLLKQLTLNGLCATGRDREL
jgi:hypothetical protein